MSATTSASTAQAATTTAPTTTAMTTPSTSAVPYSQLVLRNSGYVSDVTQSRIASTRLLIAGCGLGASTAIAACRFGFTQFTLIDGDTVSDHNLNRQFYDHEDIGVAKVKALKKQILRINPSCQVECREENLTKENVASIVSSCDFIFDTIDFLDLDAILSLHTAAKQLGKPIVTALSIGFGAGCLYAPADAELSLPEILKTDMERLIVASGKPDFMPSYTQVFGVVMGRIAKHLDPDVVAQVSKALTIMEDGRPCPASQISPGSFTVGAMAVSMLHDVIDGREVPQTPKMIMHSFRNHATKIVDISKD